MRRSNLVWSGQDSEANQLVRSKPRLGILVFDNTMTDTGPIVGP